MLWIECFRFTRCEPKERSVKQFDVFQNGFGFHVVRIFERALLCAATQEFLVRKEGDQFGALTQPIPELLKVPRSGEPTRKTHYCDFIRELIRFTHAPPLTIATHSAEFRAGLT